MLIIDIETCRSHYDYRDLSLKGQELVEKLSKRDPDTTPEKWWEEKAAFYPEFSKIVCVSMLREDIDLVNIASFYGKDEIKLLYDVAGTIKKYAGMPIGGFNIKNFDLPFLCKRMMVTGVDIPQKINSAGLKPWEITHIDLMEMWRFGAFNMQASLDMACFALDIESPKTEMDGSKVADAFFDGRYDDIAAYCEQDVISTYKLACRLHKRPEKPFSSTPHVRVKYQ